jgi:hypothetical protein
VGSSAGIGEEQGLGWGWRETTFECGVGLNAVLDVGVGDSAVCWKKRYRESFYVTSDESVLEKWKGSSEISTWSF